jgi:hypothetical protein
LLAALPGNTITGFGRGNKRKEKKTDLSAPDSEL